MEVVMKYRYISACVIYMIYPKQTRGEMKEVFTMKRKVIAAIMTVLVAGSALSGCGSSSGVETSGTSEVAETSSKAETEDGNQFFLALAYGALDMTPKVQSDKIIAMAEELGWRTQITNADQDPSKLLSDVESLCEMKPDVIICRGITDNSMPQIVEVCKNAGVPLILQSITASGMEDDFLTFATDPISAAGEMIGEYLESYCQENTDVTANVGYVVGDYNLEMALPRWTSCEEKASDANTLVDAEGNWVASDAMTVTEDWIQKYPEMNVIVSCSDEMTIGVIQALQAAGKSPDDYLILSYDALEVMQPYIQEGWCDASAGLDLQKQAEVLIDLCKKIQAGEMDSIEKLTPFNSLYLMTTDNADGIISGEAAIEYYEY